MMATYTIDDVLSDPQLDVAVWNRIYNRYNYSTGEWSSSPNSQSYGELQFVSRFEAAREAANEYWENEQGESMWINLDRIAEHAGA
jgi:hypothetical protein